MPAVDASKAGAALLGLAGLGLVGYLLTRQDDEQWGGGAAGWTPSYPSVVEPWFDLLNPGGGEVVFPAPEADGGPMGYLVPMLQSAPAGVDYSDVAASDKKGTLILDEFLADEPTPTSPLPALPDVSGAAGLLGALGAYLSAPFAAPYSTVAVVGSSALAAVTNLFAPGGAQQPAPAVNLMDVMQPTTGSLYLWAPQAGGGWASVGSTPTITKKGTSATAAPQYASPEVAAFAAAGKEPQENVEVKKGQIVSAGSAGSSEPRGVYAPAGNVYSAPGTALGGSSGSVMSSKSASILSGDSAAAKAWRAKYGGG